MYSKRIFQSKQMLASHSIRCSEIYFFDNDSKCFHCKMAYATLTSIFPCTDSYILCDGAKEHQTYLHKKLDHCLEILNLHQSDFQIVIKQISNSAFVQQFLFSSSMDIESSLFFFLESAYIYCFVRTSRSDELLKSTRS